MFEVLVFGLLAGLDNLQVSSSLALLPIERRRLHLLAAAFCVSELGAALLGLSLGRGMIKAIGPGLAHLGPTIMLLCGCAVLYLAWRQDDNDLAALVNRRGLLLGLPLSLSVDNLLAGAGISFSSYPLVPSTIIIGAVSGAMACAGLYLGRWVRRFLPERIEVAVGVYLCFLAVRAIMTDTN